MVHEAGICIPVPSYTSPAIISIGPLTGQILPVYPYHILAFFMNHSALEDEPTDVASHPEDWNPSVLHAISIGPQFSDLLNFECANAKLLYIIVIRFVPFASETTSTFLFCSLSLLFHLSYIYDVHLSALNGHHNTTIELLRESHLNINNTDIKMLVVMSLNLLLHTESLLYDMILMTKT